MANNLQPGSSDDTQFAQPLYTPIKRRSFFMYAGATAGATALLLSSCDDDDDDNVKPNTVSLGSGDVGVLNYAYALEQLEAAFYAKVVSAPAADFSANELAYFQQVAKHEAIHRDFFKAALNRDASGQAITDLTPKFDVIDFTKRASVLQYAQTFEDLGVAAYNGAGKLIKNAAYLVIAGQIVSVEARHAAIIRDFVSNGTFSDTADGNGLDQQMAPSAVLAAAQPFITQTIDGSKVGQ